MMLTGVTSHFSAAHRSPASDPLGGGTLHGHSYRVTAWFLNEHHADARMFKVSLETVLRQWDHTELSAELSWAEDIARAVGTLNMCVEVLVERPLEGFSARWTAAQPHPSPGGI